MLRFILGTGGAGKTAYIYNKIKELVLNGEKDVIMLVPDQSSFETEKAFLNLLGARLCKNVSVFGFDGMCRHVFQQTRSIPANAIDNGTRAVLMNLALEQLDDKLNLLKTKRPRAVAEMLLETLSECKKSCITTEMLRRAAENVSDETLRSKLNETALALDTFEALLSQSYIDPLDYLERLKLILSENEEIFKNKVLFVDSFSGFSTVQLEIIRILLNRCREVNISLTLDPVSAMTDEVFRVSHDTLDQIKAIAKRDGVDIKAPVKLTVPLRFENDELRALAKGVFRRRPETVSEDPENITLYSASDYYDECEYIARRIKRLIIEKGYYYNDISVICRDLKNYRGILDVIFEKYEIPFFMDAHHEISVKPVIRFIDSLFRLIIDGFSREDLLSLMKTGLTSCSSDDISAFENYVYIWNLSGKALCEPFMLHPRGFSDEFTDKDKEAIDSIERTRIAVAQPIIEFRQNCKGKTGREITKLLYRLLETLKVPDTLGVMYDALEENVEKGMGAEQIRVWGLLMDALDKTVAAVGDMSLSIERYYELLSIQISNIEFSQIPQTLDCVTVTTAQRVRTGSQKAAFLIGCIDGEFPAVPHTSGLFSGYEIKQLLLNDITLSDDFTYIANLETYMAYCAAVSPSERLYASFPMMNMDGTKLKPSVIFTEIAKVFPDIRVTDRFDYDTRLDSMLALTPAFEEYARSLSENATTLNGLDEFFRENSKYSAGSRAVTRALAREPFKIENTENARLLFGENLTVSASQVEKFSLCRFSYFCNYGLRVRERRKAEINPMEYGTLVHYILELFFTKYKKDEYSKLDRDEIYDFIRSSVSEYLEGYFGGSESKESSFLYRLDVLCSHLLLMLTHIIEELCQSDFDVADCELKIGGDIPAYTVSLPTGQNIAVCGSVDRVDVMRTENETFLRIVDYKTGAKTFKLSDILYGLNLQMLLYLCSIQKNGAERYGKTTPAGILYMPAVVPNIKADGLDSEAISKAIGADFKMNGLLLDDVRVIKGMDKTESAKYIPVKIKNGSNSGSDSLATLEQFGKIFGKLNDTVAQMGEKLFGGDIEAIPLKGGADACQYCPYDSVCGYRRGEGIDVIKHSSDEVLRQLDEEQSGGEENAALD